MSNLLWPTDYSTPGLHVPHQLPKFAQVHVHCIGDANQPSHPLMPSSPWLLIFPSIRDFPMSQLFASKYWSFSFNISPSNEYSGLISLKIDWFDLSAVQVNQVFSNITVWKYQFIGTLPSLQSNSHNCMWQLGRPWKWKWKWSRSVVSNSLWPPRTVAYQAPPSMGFSRQEYWSGVPFSSPGDLPKPEVKPGSRLSTCIGRWVLYQ